MTAAIFGTVVHPARAVGSPIRPSSRTTAAEMARLAERARIARELHDRVSQTLYAITLAAAQARSLCEQTQGGEIQHALDGLLELANEGQSELRAMLTSMRSDWPSPGSLVNQLETLAAAVRARSSIDIRLSLADEPDMLPQAKHELVMISREALNNVLRHASATRVDIVLEVGASAMVLDVIDNGRGFDQELSHPGHFGLRSMRERAQAVGGSLELNTANGVGTRVRVCMPREAQRGTGLLQACAG